MNNLQTLLYLMNDRVYGNPGHEATDATGGENSRRLFVAGKTPAWLDDFMLLFPDLGSAEEGDAKPGAGDLVLLTEETAARPDGGIVLDAAGGKKKLWYSILASGLLDG
ncbi:MAG: hypothetical protein IJ523_02520 [Succinivibrionaceae bacterium]|nr:hypothetical protein [Succinivibrionaceae bacterium]